MKMKISILCPTRERQENIKRLVKSVENCTKKIDDVELLLYIDNDDEKSLNISDWLDKYSFVKTILGERCKHLSDSWNILWKNATGEIFMLCGDDIVFETIGWDNTVRKHFNKFDDHIMLVCGNDGIKHGPTHPFVHKNWTDTVGYFTPENMSYGNDSWINHLSLNLNINERRIFDGFKTTHLHFSCHKSKIDKTYSDLLSRAGKNRDRKRRIEALDIIKLDAEKLRKFIDDFKK